MIIKDCRLINDNNAVIITRSAAGEALYAMKFAEKHGYSKNMMKDDRSFFTHAIGEFDKAMQEGKKNTSVEFPEGLSVDGKLRGNKKGEPSGE